MRMETFIRKGLRLKAHRVVKIEEDEAPKELVVHLDRREHRRLHCGECGRAGGGGSRRRAGRRDAGEISPSANTSSRWCTRPRASGVPGAACGWNACPGPTSGNG
jgi:hypothetical protein